MAIKSKREIERKTEEFVKNRKSELDRILYFVKNNEKGMGYESAYSSLKSMAAGLSDLADIFKQWANDDRQGKLEESVKPARKSFKQYLTESVLPTQNEGWGFFGTITMEYDHNSYEKAKEAWKIAFQEVQKATGWADKEVRDWLDSGDGRHFADQCADFGAGKNPADGISQATKFWKERKWFK